MKKRTQLGVIYFHPKRLAVIYQIHASCFISSRGDVQSYWYCRHCLTHVECYMCFRDGTATIGGMRKRILGRRRPINTTPRKMSGRKTFMHRLVNTLLL